jgi:hypothetical protein
MWKKSEEKGAKKWGKITHEQQQMRKIIFS